MADVIIKGMEMPRGCYSCHIGNHMGLFVVQCPITKSKIDGFTENIRLSDCPLRPAPEWISVKERLPEDEKPVVARYGFISSRTTGQYFIGTLTYFAFDPVPHWQHESTGLHVTHWMTLPEPTEGGDGDG